MSRMNTAAMVRERIKQYIVENQLAPGDAMPSEATLCQELEVSRSSVREAISQLGALDMVHVEHGRGIFVGEISLAPLVNSVLFRFQLDHRGELACLTDVVQVRRALDLGQAQAVVENMHGRYNDELHTIVNAMMEKGLQGQDFMPEDKSFHVLMQQSVADNRLLPDLTGAFWEIHMAASKSLRESVPQDIDDTIRAHGDMLAAAEAGDVAAYRAAVIAHYQPLLRRIEETPQPASVSAPQSGAESAAS